MQSLASNHHVCYSYGTTICMTFVRKCLPSGGYFLHYTKLSTFEPYTLTTLQISQAYIVGGRYNISKFTGVVLPITPIGVGPSPAGPVLAGPLFRQFNKL